MIPTGTELFNGVQDLLSSAGDNACYLLQLFSVCEEHTKRYVPVLSSIIHCINAGDVSFNEDNFKDPNNFFVQDATAVIKRVTGLSCVVRKEYELSYKPKQNEYVIDHWFDNSRGKEYFHFNSTILDTLQKSQTARNGKIISKRIVSFF